MATPAPIELSSIGMADSLILMVLALVVFGPRRLPQIGRQIGKLMYEFRKASNDFKFQMEEELRLAEEADRRKQEEAARQKTALAAPPPSIEAQADIGAAEPSGITQPSADTPEPVSAEPEVVHLPRVSTPILQPPSTGTTVAASRPNGAQEPATESNIGAGAESAIPSLEPNSSEPADQHG